MYNGSAIVGIAEVTSDPYPDPKEKSGKLVVVDIRPRERLARPVTLAEIKARSELKDFDLVRLPRLSVMPVGREQWNLLLDMSRR